jgi:hypothetical protein
VVDHVVRDQRFDTSGEISRELEVLQRLGGKKARIDGYRKMLVPYDPGQVGQPIFPTLRRLQDQREDEKSIQARKIYLQNVNQPVPSGPGRISSVT